jgi:hypothetical protein
MNRSAVIPSFPKTAGVGAVLGFTTALVYGALFCLYAILRVTWMFWQAPANGAPVTLLANAFSLITAAMFFAIFAGLMAAPIQAAVLCLAAFLSRKWNRAGESWRGAWIGLGCATLFILLLHALILSAPPLLSRLLWESGYFLWSGLPSLIFLGLNFYLGWKNHP